MKLYNDDEKKLWIAVYSNWIIRNSSLAASTTADKAVEYYRDILL